MVTIKVCDAQSSQFTDISRMILNLTGQKNYRNETKIIHSENQVVGIKKDREPFLLIYTAEKFIKDLKKTLSQLSLDTQFIKTE